MPVKPGFKARATTSRKRKLLTLAETEITQCRYGERALELWGNWTVLWSEMDPSWQGSAAFLVTREGKFAYCKYIYGSCEDCDNWMMKKLSGAQVVQEMNKNSMHFDDLHHLENWIIMLEGTSDIKGAAFRKIFNKLIHSPESQNYRQHLQTEIEYGHLSSLEID